MRKPANQVIGGRGKVRNRAALRAVQRQFQSFIGGETLTFINKCLHFATCQLPAPRLACFASLAGMVRCLGGKSPKQRFTHRL
jgi:hypothetical protein